jgi:hypothetical protein
MKKLLFLSLILLFAGNIASAQAPTVKRGTKLVYYVEMPDKKYDYVVTVNKFGPSMAFDWAMSEPVNTSGSVSIGAGALATATSYKNYFEDDSKATLTNQSTIWLSKKNFNELKLKGKTKMDMTGSSYLYEKDAQPMDISYETKAGTVNAKVLVAEFIKTADTKYTIHVFNDAKNPLIQYMDLGSFTIKLKRVE